MTNQQDHFALFGLPRHYDIDRQQLDAAYERLTLEFHPDFFATAPEAKREEAERVSARVNEAYRTLSDDTGRADYLLNLLANGQQLDDQRLPPGFLQEVFLLQEEVDTLQGAANAERTATLKEQITGRCDAVRDEVARLFQTALKAPQAEVLLTIQENLNCVRYLQRLLSRLEGEDFGL